MILTIDMGTTVTKVSLWGPDGMVAHCGIPLVTARPGPDRAEQDPSSWWASLVDGCARLRAGAGDHFGAVEVVGCTGARQSLVMVGADGTPLGPALVWSDRRAASEATALAGAMGGGEEVFDRTGVPVEAGSVAAKLAWLATHRGPHFDAAAWILTPRDLVAWWLSGRVVTDPTMASRSGLYDLDGRVVDGLAGAASAKLAPIVPADRVSGHLGAAAAGALGLVEGTPVVIGAGDRACEVVGAGAGGERPMVSWGTTANVSWPVDHRPGRRPGGLVLSRGALGGWLVEGGLSAAGSLMDWLGRISGRTPAELAGLAGSSPPGARGVVAAPWLDGARAPWWNHGAAAGFVGLTAAHGLEDLARAAFESVAWEVRRCLEEVGPAPVELALAGTGSSVPVWVEVLTGVTGLPAVRRRSGQAASAGAAVLAAAAVGMEFDLDTADPVADRVVPVDAAVDGYRRQRDRVDRVAGALVALEGAGDRPGPGAGPCA